MFRLCHKRLQFSFQIYGNVGSSVTYFHSLRSVFFSSKTSSPKDYSFVVSTYLRNSWGLSSEIALSVSEKVNLKTPEKSDLVLSLFRDYGFSETHIAKLVESYPRLLLADAHQTLLPKFEFLSSVGISGKDLTETVSRNPSFLFYSLEKNIIPFYNVINRELVVGQQVAKVFKMRPWRFSSKKMLSDFGVNISVLRELGVRNACIVSLLTGYRAFGVYQNTDKFKENVEKAIGLGFDPSMWSFTCGLGVISTMDESKWAEKMEFFSKCGWTEDETLSAFRRSPVIMTLSEKNVSSKMDLFVNGMGWKLADIAGVPNVLHYGLEKWILPRCSVIKVLLSKDLIKEKPSLSNVFVSTKEKFLKKFVIRYQEQVPELPSVFNGKMSVVELGKDLRQKCEEKTILA